MNMETTWVDRFGEQSEITSTKTLLTWKIDNLCSEGITRQLQSHPSVHRHGGHVLVSDIRGEVTLSAKDVGSDYNKRGFDWNHIDFCCWGSMFRATSRTIFRLCSILGTSDTWTGYENGCSWSDFNWIQEPYRTNQCESVVLATLFMSRPG